MIQQFYVGPERFVVCDVFSASFDGFFVTVSMDRSTRFRLDVSAFFSIGVCSNITDGIHIIFIVCIYIKLFIRGINIFSSSLAVEWGHNKSLRSLMVIEQVSQGILPEVHSRRIWGPQSPYPPAFLYLAETLVLAAYLIYRHDRHVSMSVSFSIKVFHHRRFLRFPMRDVETMATDSAVYGLSSITYCNQFSSK